MQKNNDFLTFSWSQELFETKKYTLPIYVFFFSKIGFVPIIPPNSLARAYAEITTDSPNLALVLTTKTVRNQGTNAP